MSDHAMPSSAATICDHCGKPMPIATNPPGQTTIRNFHDWDCYSAYYGLTRQGGPVHTVSHDERVQSGELPP